MFGFGFCCCDKGCDVLGSHNDTTPDQFAAHYELGDNSSEPVWSENDAGDAIASFSGNMDAKIIASRAKYANDNIGMEITPTGNYTELRYDFAFSSVVYSFIWNYEEIDGELFCVRFRLLKGETVYFDSDEFPCNDLSAILSTTLAYVIRREDRNGNPRVCFYVGNHLIDRQEQPETLDLTVPVEISYSINGTNYALDSTSGFVRLFKPDKWWLFPENLPSSATQEQRDAGEKEREGCPYPESCTAVWENSLPIIPPLKLTFSGWTDKTYVTTNNSAWYSDRKYLYSSINSKYAAADISRVWTSWCGIQFGFPHYVGGIRYNDIWFSVRDRGFAFSESVESITTYNNESGDISEELVNHLSGWYGNSGITGKKDNGVDYDSSASRSVQYSAITIEDANSNAKISLNMSVPFYNERNTSIEGKEAAAFEKQIEKINNERIEWRDLIDIVLEQNEATANAIGTHIGAAAKAKIEFDSDCRIHTDSTRPESVAVRFNLSFSISYRGEINLTDCIWAQNSANPADWYHVSVFRNCIVNIDSLEKYESRKTALDTTITLEPVYEKDDDGNDILCNMLYYTNKEPLAVNGWTFAAEAIKYRLGESGATYNSNLISGSVQTPLINVGNVGNLVIYNQHMVTESVTHETDRGTTTMYFTAAENNDSRIQGTLNDIANANKKYRVKTPSVAESNQDEYRCVAHNDRHFVENVNGRESGCYTDVFTEVLL